MARQLNTVVPTSSPAEAALDRLITSYSPNTANGVDEAYQRSDLPVALTWSMQRRARCFAPNRNPQAEGPGNHNNHTRNFVYLA